MAAAQAQPTRIFQLGYPRLLTRILATAYAIEWLAVPPAQAENRQLQNAMWVTINPNTGLVNSESVSADPNGGTVPTTVGPSRTLAAQAQGMGGR